MVGTLSAGLIALLSLLSISAWAEGAAIALEPVHVVDGEEDEAARLETVIRKQLEARGFAVVSPERVAAALKSERAECLEDAGCVAKVSQKLKVAELLHFTVAPYAPRVRATGRLLTREGEAYLKTTDLAPGAKDRVRIASAVIERALDELGLTAQKAAVESTAEVVARPEIVPEPVGPVKDPGPVKSPGPAEPPAVDGSPLLRAGSYAAMGMGGASLLGGVALALSAQASANEFNSNVANGNARSANSVRELFLRSEQQRFQSIALLAAGAGLLTAGSVLYFKSAPAPEVSAGVALQNSEFSVTVSGRF